jgi:hypothetical protein
MDGVDADLGKAIQASPVWRAKEALYRGVPGIGPVISRTRVTRRCVLPADRWRSCRDSGKRFSYCRVLSGDDSRIVASKSTTHDRARGSPVWAAGIADRSGGRSVASSRAGRRRQRARSAPRCWPAGQAGGQSESTSARLWVGGARSRFAELFIARMAEQARPGNGRSGPAKTDSRWIVGPFSGSY